MKENQEYIRKRRPINFTLPDLEADSSDVGHDFDVCFDSSGEHSLVNQMHDVARKPYGECLALLKSVGCSIGKD